jgi:hypothetical protein
MGLGLNRIGRLVSQATVIVRSEKRISIPLLAARLGYRSPEYFRRSQLKLILELNDCIALEDNDVVWICDDRGGGEAQEGG